MEDCLEAVPPPRRLAEAGVKVLILDFDGVVTCVKVDWRYVRARLSEILGRRVTSILQLLREEFGTPTHRVVSSFVRYFEEKGLRDSRPTSFALKYIPAALNAGLRVWVATMQESGTADSFLRRWGLRKYLVGVLGRESFSCKAGMVRHVMMVEDVGDGDVLMIDDSLRNVAEVSALGVRCVACAARECIKLRRG